MRFTRRVSTPVSNPEDVRIPRVVIRRESIWSYPPPVVAGRVELNAFPTGRLLASAFVVYTGAQDVQEFEDSTLPVVGALRYSRSHITAGFVLRAASFDAGFMRHCVDRCHGQGTTTVVEIGGTWSTSSLEVLWSIRPRYLRIGPEYVRGANHVPEQYQSLVRLSEFAESNGVPLIARGVRTWEERAALRAAGIVLFHAADSGTADHDPLAELSSLGSQRPPTVLRFPLRPLGR